MSARATTSQLKGVFANRILGQLSAGSGETPNDTVLGNHLTLAANRVDPYLQAYTLPLTNADAIAFVAALEIDIALFTLFRGTASTVVDPSITAGFNTAIRTLQSISDGSLALIGATRVDVAAGSLSYGSAGTDGIDDLSVI